MEKPPSVLTIDIIKNRPVVLNKLKYGICSASFYWGHNMNQKTTTLLNVILNAAAAIVWTINCILAGYNGSPEIILVLDITCAIIWWVVFAVALIRYRKGKHDK